MISKSDNMDFNVILQGINDPDLRRLVMRLGKNKPDDIVQSINGMKQILLETDEQSIVEYAATYIDIFTFYIKSPYAEVRVSLCSMISDMIPLLKIHCEGFIPKLLPAILMYLHDEEKNIRLAARDLIRLLPGGNTAREMIKKYATDIGKYISTIFIKLDSHDNGLDPKTWGRICGSALGTATDLLSTIDEMSGIPAEAIAYANVISWLQPTRGYFNKNSTPLMRAAGYDFMTAGVTKDIITNYPEFKDLVFAENFPFAQSRLLNFGKTLMEKEYLAPVIAEHIILDNLFRFSDPEAAHLKDFINFFEDDQLTYKLLSKAMTLENNDTCGILFIVFTRDVNQTTTDFMVDSFIKALQPETVGFLKNCSLSIFERIANDRRIDESLFETKDSRAVTFIKYIGKERAMEWLRSQTRVSPTSMSTFIACYGFEAARAIFPDIHSIPFGTYADRKADDDAEMEGFVVEHREKKKQPKKNIAKPSAKNKSKKAKKQNRKGNETEIEDDEDLYRCDDPSFMRFILGYGDKEDIRVIAQIRPDKLRYLMENWRRSYDEFNIPEVEDIIEEIVMEDPKIYKILKKIFPDNEILSKVMENIAINQLERGERVNDDMLNDIKPGNEVLDALLYSEQIEKVNENHPLLKHLVNRLVETISEEDYESVADAASILVMNANVNPRLFGYKYRKFPKFYSEFWGNVGFEEFEDEDVVQLLESFIRKYMPWIDALIYLRDIDWSIIPNKLGDYIVNNAGRLSEVAYVQELKYALACCFAADPNVQPKRTDSLTLVAACREPPKKLKRMDDTALDLAIEWRHVLPITPDFRKPLDVHQLRRTIVYLRNQISVLSEFGPIVKPLEEAIKNSDRLSFLLITQILSLMADAVKSLDCLELMILYFKKCTQLAPFPEMILPEVIRALNLCKILNENEFAQLIIDCTECFMLPISQTNGDLIVPLMQYHNSWDLLDDNIRGRLDLSNGYSWNFITRCLRAMPEHKRHALNSKFAGQLPALLLKLDPSSPEFESLVATFPAGAARWVSRLDENQQKKLTEVIAKKVTPVYFKQIRQSLLKREYNNVKFNVNKNDLSIIAKYSEEAGQKSFNLYITLPRAYPIGRPTIKCKFGNEDLENECQEKIETAITVSKEIEDGVRAWYSYMTNVLMGSAPCSICMAYIDSVGTPPTETCETCGAKLHKSCLKVWFRQCRYPRCPLCNSSWKKKA